MFDFAWLTFSWPFLFRRQLLLYSFDIVALLIVSCLADGFKLLFAKLGGELYIQLRDNNSTRVNLAFATPFFARSPSRSLLFLSSPSFSLLSRYYWRMPIFKRLTYNITCVCCVLSSILMRDPRVFYSFLSMFSLLYLNLQIYLYPFTYLSVTRRFLTEIYQVSWRCFILLTTLLVVHFARSWSLFFALLLAPFGRVVW